MVVMLLVIPTAVVKVCSYRISISCFHFECVSLFFFHVVQCFLVNTTTSPILVFAGAFVGCSLEGSIVTTRTQVNSRFYGSQSLNASDILLGSLPKPPAAATLYRALSDLYQKLQW